MASCDIVRGEFVALATTAAKEEPEKRDHDEEPDDGDGDGDGDFFICGTEARRCVGVCIGGIAGCCWSGG